MITASSAASTVPQTLPLFGVFFDQGSYDDAVQSVLFVTHDEQAATAYVEYQETLYTSMRAKIAQSHAAGEAWKKSNPQPAIVEPTRLPLPSWDGVRNITPEMRAERKRIKDENERLYSEANAPLRQWTAKVFNVIKDAQAASLTAEEKAAHASDNYNSYSVEPLDWMPPLDTLLPVAVSPSEDTCA